MTENLSQNCRGLSIRYKCGMIRLSDLQWERIRHHFPEENIADGRPGRRPVSTRQVLEGALWILNTGAQWHMLPQCYPNYKTVHRRFQTWCRSEVLPGILMDIANELRERGVLDEEECFIDATFVMAKGRRRRGRTDQAWKRHENHGDRGSPRLAALGQHPRREPSRSAPGTIVLRLLHDRSQAGKSHRRPCLRQRPARPRVRSGWRRDDRAAPLEPNEAADARPAPPATLLAALVGRTLLRLDPVAASDPRPMGISSRELPWLRSTRLPRCPLQAILR